MAGVLGPCTHCADLFAAIFWLTDSAGFETMPIDPDEAHRRWLWNVHNRHPGDPVIRFQRAEDVVMDVVLQEPLTAEEDDNEDHWDREPDGTFIYIGPRKAWHVSSDYNMFTVTHCAEQLVEFEGENCTPRHDEARDTYYSWPDFPERKICIIHMWCCICNSRVEAHCMCPASIISMNKILHEAVENQWGRRRKEDCHWPDRHICADCAVMKRNEDRHGYLKRLKKAIRLSGWTEVKAEGAARMSKWIEFNPMDREDRDQHGPGTNTMVCEMANEIWAYLWGFEDYEAFRRQHGPIPLHEFVERRDFRIPTTFLGYTPPPSRFDRPGPRPMESESD